MSKHYRPKMGERTGVPTITVPRTLTQITYFNIPLALMLQDKGMDKMHVEVDRADKSIILRAPKRDEKGYKLLRTGERGYGITPKLRKVLPAGRYQMTSKRPLAFAKV